MTNKKCRLMIRFDEATFMKIKEVSQRLGCSYSVVIRAFVEKQLAQLTDSSGVLKLNGKKKEELGPLS